MRNEIKLTQRQVQVLRFLGNGYSSQEIANRLDIGKRTVDFHCISIYERLRVHNRVAAINKARDLGLI